MDPLTLRQYLFYCIGFGFRYFILLPCRVFVAILGFAYFIIFSQYLRLYPNTDRKSRRYHATVVMQLFNRALGTILNHHYIENRPKDGGIAVANHTTILDIVTLMADQIYSIIGQQHPGFIGWFESNLDEFVKNIWFDRNSKDDRTEIMKLMTDHVTSKPAKDPILIFPEGTCINNTSVMMFKKGSFNIPTTFHPIAVKYNAIFADAFWNSSEQSAVRHIFNILTSWCVVADIYYLPGERKHIHETDQEFADRIKQAIAKHGRLKNLTWDGALKRKKVRKDQRDKSRSDYVLQAFTHQPLLRKLSDGNSDADDLKKFQ